MSPFRFYLFVLVLSWVVCGVSGFSGAARKGPAQRVVGLLEALRQEVDQEGERESTLAKEAACECVASENDLDADLAAQRARLSDLKTI